jgi:hypothetical protein
MSSTIKRLAVVAALGTMGILAPVGSASAAITPVTPAGLALPAAGLGFPGTGLGFPGTGLPAFTPAPLSFVAPSVGGVAAVIGPTIITTAPGVTFINTNNQVSAGSPVMGGQVAGP